MLNYIYLFIFMCMCMYMCSNVHTYMCGVKQWLSELSFLLLPCGSMDWIQVISFGAVAFSYWAILQALLHFLIECNLFDVAFVIPVNYHQVQAPEWEVPATRASKDLERPVEAFRLLLIIGYRLQLMNKHWPIWSIKYTIQIKQWRLSQVLYFYIVSTLFSRGKDIWK